MKGPCAPLSSTRILSPLPPFCALCCVGISGANINPAVTLALAITRKMSFFRAVCYVFAQV